MKTTRWIVQFGFLALVLTAVFVFRANCEVWCPFGGVEALYTYAAEGNMPCSLGVSNFYILGGVLVMTLLLRRALAKEREQRYQDVRGLHEDLERIQRMV